MDSLIIAEKLESLRRCIQRIQEKTPPEIESLTQNPDIQDILVLNLTRAGQLCVDIGSHVVSESGRSCSRNNGRCFHYTQQAWRNHTGYL